MNRSGFHGGYDGSGGWIALTRFATRWALKTWLELICSAEEIAAIIPGRTNRLAWLEFQNKLRAFYFFEHSDTVVGSSPEGGFDIRGALAQLSRLEKWDSVWAAEGIGRQYASLGPMGALHSLESNAASIEKYLVPLHTGMGLSFAEAALQGAACGERTIAESLDQFYDLCRLHSHEGFVEAAYEVLGLVARTLFPHLVARIDGALAQSDPEKLPYFWHGIGRGMYFLPTGFFPGDWPTWRAMQIALEEPPHALGQLNATAGVAWAFTLVNMRQPEILAAFFESYGEAMRYSDAVANGIRSAFVIWLHCAPDDPHWHSLSESSAIDQITDSRFWEQYVYESCVFAARFSKIAAERHQLGKMFHYRPLAESTRELQRDATTTFNSCPARMVGQRLRV